MAFNLQKLFQPVQLTASLATIFTAAANPTTTIISRLRVRFTNTDTVQRAVTCNVVPNGGAAGASNQVLNAETIAPNSHLDVDLPTMAAGDFLQASADVTLKVTLHQLDEVTFS